MNMWSEWRMDVGLSGGGGWSAHEAELSQRKNSSPRPPSLLCCTNLPLIQGFSTWPDIKHRAGAGTEPAVGNQRIVIRSFEPEVTPHICEERD